MSFTENPYRKNALAALGLDKGDTNLASIQQAINEAYTQWRAAGGVVPLADGRQWRLSEGELNNLKAQVLSPLTRLKTEQYVHARHTLDTDPEIESLIHEIAATLGRNEIAPEFIEEMGAAAMTQLGAFLPGFDPPPISDDLPWPEEPSALEIGLEPLSKTALRDG